jgi:hypothetical protein
MGFSFLSLLQNQGILKLRSGPFVSIPHLFADVTDVPVLHSTVHNAEVIIIIMGK